MQRPKVRKRGKRAAPQRAPFRLRPEDFPPLAMFFSCRQYGHAVPESVLRAMDAAWARYRDANGTLDLETAFLGRPRRGVGNFAARSRANGMKLAVSLLFYEAAKRGQSKNDVIAASGVPMSEDAMRRVSTAAWADVESALATLEDRAH